MPRHNLEEATNELRTCSRTHRVGVRGRHPRLVPNRRGSRLGDAILCAARDASAKALAELRAAEADALANPAWLDQAKGVVRLPIAEAMRMVERDWGQNPAAARSNLIDRVEKATALPPKVPEKPSAFE